MARTELEAAIDRLYQLPPDEFVEARNRLAKEVGSGEGARVRALGRPVVPAWAVNQLYWRSRPTFDRVVSTAEVLKGAHDAIAKGRAADLRAADRDHHAAIAEALRETVRLLREAGHEPTPTVEHAISETLSALPSSEAGRLTKPLRAPGFGSLLGLAAAGGAKAPPKLALVRPAPGKGPDKGDRERIAAERKAAEKEAAKLAREIERAREEQQEAERARRAADTALRQADAALAKARRAEEVAREDLARAEAERAGAELAARRAKEEAARAAKRADQTAGIVDALRREAGSK